MKRKPALARETHHHKISPAPARLEQAKANVLNSLTSPDAQRGYRYAIDEFVDWYCLEPRLAFNRTVVLRYQYACASVSSSRPRPNFSQRPFTYGVAKRRNRFRERLRET
jgi:hypothetical protein